MTKRRDGEAGVNSLSRDALISRAGTSRSLPREVAAEMVRTTSWKHSLGTIGRNIFERSLVKIRDIAYECLRPLAALSHPSVRPSGSIATLECPRWTLQKVHSGRSGLYDWLKTRGTRVYSTHDRSAVPPRRKYESPMPTLIGRGRIKTYSE